MCLLLGGGGFTVLYSLHTLITATETAQQYYNVFSLNMSTCAARSIVFPFPVTAL